MTSAIVVQSHVLETQSRTTFHGKLQTDQRLALVMRQCHLFKIDTKCRRYRCIINIEFFTAPLGLLTCLFRFFCYLEQLLQITKQFQTNQNLNLLNSSASSKCINTCYCCFFSNLNWVHISSTCCREVHLVRCKIKDHKLFLYCKLSIFCLVPRSYFKFSI